MDHYQTKYKHQPKQRRVDQSCAADVWLKYPFHDAQIRRIPAKQHKFILQPFMQNKRIFVESLSKRARTKKQQGGRIITCQLPLKLGQTDSFLRPPYPA